MMARYALIGLLVLCLGLGGGLWLVLGQRDTARATAAALRSELATATARLEQAAQANAVHRAYIDRMREQSTQAAADEADAMTTEGADAPLPDYLRDILDRLR